MQLPIARHRCWSFLVGAAVLSSIRLTAVNVTVAQDGPPNVLFIAVDDLRTELGCYDLPYVDSPNLDRLASQGVLFRNHFVQVPTCGASRYALLTGRSPRNSGVTRANHAFYRGPSALASDGNLAAQSLPETFRRNGYQTICIGKLSHTADGRVYEYNGQGDGRPEMPHAWDQLATPLGAWKRGWGIFFA
jgi:arylsulfatase A-like enzyme